MPKQPTTAEITALMRLFPTRKLISVKDIKDFSRKWLKTQILIKELTKQSSLHR